MKKHGAQRQRLPKTGIKKGSLRKHRTTWKKKGPVVGIFNDSVLKFLRNNNNIDHPQKPVVCF